MITNGFTYIAVLVFIAALLVWLQRYTKSKFFDYAPPIVLLYLIRINRITISAGASGLLFSFCSAAVSCIMPQKASFLKTFCHKLPDFT